MSEGAVDDDGDGDDERWMEESIKLASTNKS